MPIERAYAGHSLIQNEILDNKGLSLKAKGLYAYLASRPDGWEASSERIAEDQKDGRESVRSGIHELEKAGLLTRTKENNSQGRLVTTYTLRG